MCWVLNIRRIGLACRNTTFKLEEWGHTTITDLSMFRLAWGGGRRHSFEASTGDNMTAYEYMVTRLSTSVPPKRTRLCACEGRLARNTLPTTHLVLACTRELRPTLEWESGSDRGLSRAVAKVVPSSWNAVEELELANSCNSVCWE